MKKLLLDNKRFTNNIYLKSTIILAFLFGTSFASNAQLKNNYKEKVYLHLDKPYYTSGENIWLKAYLVDAKTNQPIILSKVLYVDLIDPLNKIVASKTLKIEKGGAAGDFE